MTNSPQRPPLTRDTQRRVFSGIAAGIARYFGIDTWIVRTALVVAGLIPPHIGIVAYAIALIVMRPDSGGPSPYEQFRQEGFQSAWSRLSGRTDSPFTKLLMIVAAIVLLIILTGTQLWAVVPALGLVLLGAYLLRSDESSTAHAASAQPETHSSAITTDAHTESTNPPPSTEHSVITPAYGQSARPPAEVARPRTKSAYILAVNAIALIALGTAIALRAVDVIDLSAAQIVAIAAALLGLGAIIGALIGRGRLLLVESLLLMLIVLPTTAAASTGSRLAEAAPLVYQPVNLEQVQTDYRTSAQPMLVDLSRVEFNDTKPSVNVSTRVGEVVVVVPKDTKLDIDADSDAGELDILGEKASGFGNHISTTRDGARGPLSIDTRATFGRVVVVDNPEDSRVLELEQAAQHRN